MGGPPVNEPSRAVPSPPYPGWAPGYGAPQPPYGYAWLQPLPFEDPRRNLRAILGLGIAFLAAVVLLVLAFAYIFPSVLTAPPRSSTSPAPPPGFFAALGGVMLAELLFFAVSLAQALVTGFWCMRAARNIRALGGVGFSWSPGWGLGGWFIPYANLVIPLLVMREIWRGSQPGAPQAWRGQKVPGWVALWWALWVASPILLELPFLLTMFRHSASGVQFAPDRAVLVWTVPPACLLVAALVLFLRLLRGIANAQLASARLRGVPLQ